MVVCVPVELQSDCSHQQLLFSMSIYCVKQHVTHASRCARQASPHTIHIHFQRSAAQCIQSQSAWPVFLECCNQKQITASVIHQPTICIALMRACQCVRAHAPACVACHSSGAAAVDVVRTPRRIIYQIQMRLIKFNAVILDL